MELKERKLFEGREESTETEEKSREEKSSLKENQVCVFIYLILYTFNV